MRYGLLLIASLWVSFVQAETRWFVMSEIVPNRGESYLLPLSDPTDIEQARMLIEEGPGGSVGSIASVQIAAGTDGFNRDWLHKEQPLWSWHIVRFDGFADFAIEICDGWPGFVEEDVEAFIANTNGQLCFWGYTVTAELESPLEYGVTALDEGAWFDPAASGQGVFLDILDDSGNLFAAWFTFSDQDDVTSEQRWYTLQQVDDALTIFATTGGRLAQPSPVDTQSVGTAELEFIHCNSVMLHYAFDEGSTATASLQRLIPRDNCEPLQ